MWVARPTNQPRWCRDLEEKPGSYPGVIRAALAHQNAYLDTYNALWCSQTRLCAVFREDSVVPEGNKSYIRKQEFPHPTQSTRQCFLLSYCLAVGLHAIDIVHDMANVREDTNASGLRHIPFRMGTGDTPSVSPPWLCMCLIWRQALVNHSGHS